VPALDDLIPENRWKENSNCWDTSVDYTLLLTDVEKPSNACEQPTRSSYPFDACIYTPLSDIDLYVQYSCNPQQRILTQQFFATRETCMNNDVSAFMERSHHFDTCIEDYPNEKISIFDCYDKGINFTWCTRGQTTPNTPTQQKIPTLHPTDVSSCDSCLQPFSDAGFCQHALSGDPITSLVPDECVHCGTQILLYCIKKTTSIPTKFPTYKGDKDLFQKPTIPLWRLLEIEVIQTIPKVSLLSCGSFYASSRPFAA